MFPLNGKVPFPGTRGFLDATDDPARLQEFEWPDANYGYVPWSIGCVAFDLDLYKPGGVNPGFLELLPPTYTVRTPSGGEHRLYLAPRPYGNRAIMQNVDIRGGSGYLVGPGSTMTGGTWTVIDDRDPVALPEALQRLLDDAEEGQGEPIQAPATSPLGALDTARAWLAGLHGDLPRYNVAAALMRDFGLSLDDAEQVWRESGVRFESTKSNGQSARVKLIHALRYGKGEPGRGYAAAQEIAELHATEAALRAVNGTPGEWLPDPMQYTAAWWADRDLPPRVKLIGPLMTACRAMLVAPTGAGKTMLGMAIGAALASGTAVTGSWFHAPRPMRVLYVDGEMPLALLQERLRDAVRRAGDVGDRFILLSLADFPEVPPLNKGGIIWLDGMIHRFKPDLIELDNLGALTDGDLKDSEGWRALEAWQRRITNANIAQLWIHHANADGTMYGDKTRAWGLDTVINLVAAGRTLEDGFDLSYSKNRELHPGRNHQEYVTGRVKLQGNRWHFESSEMRAREHNAAVNAELSAKGAGVSALCIPSEFARRVEPKITRQAVTKKGSPWLKWMNTDGMMRWADYSASLVKDAEAVQSVETKEAGSRPVN